MILPKAKYTSALALLALALGGIGTSYGKPTPVTDNWTLVGPSSGGGFVIVGDSPLNLGELSPTTKPVHLSANGSDIITLDAGSTASTTSTPVIDFEAPGNILNNYGSIIGEFNALIINSAGNVINNWGTINGTAGNIATTIVIENDSNTVNNWGVILSGDVGIFVDGQDNIINNHGSISAPFEGIVFNLPGNTLNNWGAITGGDYGISVNAPGSTINNWGTIDVTGGSAEGIDLESGPNVVNNRGIVLSGDVGVFVEGGGNNIVNNWGSISGDLEGVVFLTSNNVINNWGTVTSLNSAVFTDAPDNTINNWGTIIANSANTFPAASAIEIDTDSTTINNWGVITANGGPVAILATGNNNTLNLNGHSSVIGQISFQGSNNVVNLNFTGLSPATITALKSQLTPQGANSGAATPSVQFTLRGVSYDIDPAIVNFNPSSYQLQGLTPNQQAIGASLDSATTNPALGSPLAALFNGIDNSGNVPAALAALSPQQYQAYGDLAIANFTATVQEIDARLNNLRDGSESLDADAPGQATAGYSKDDGKDSKNVAPAPAPEKRWGFFATGDGLFFRGDSHDIDGQNAKANSAGTIAGVDAKIGEHFVAGALFAYNNSDATLGSDNSHATIESYSGGLYGSYHQDGFYANGLAAYTRNRYSSDRNILFPGFASAAAASTSANQESVNLDGGYDWHVNDRLTVGPVAGLQYVHLDVDGFNEFGAGIADLAVNSQDMDSLQSRVGGRIDYHLIAQEHVAFAADLHAAWQHEYLDDSRGLGASFIGTGLAPFSVQTTTPLRDAAVVGVGLNFTFHERLTLFADYELLMWRASTFEQTINGGGRISF